MSKTIQLPHGLFTLIDDEDFERCAQFKWRVNDNGYVVGHVRENGRLWTAKRLSRFVMNAPEGLWVDHIHGNLLDNRKSELRLATRAQNLWNRGKNRNNTSGFKGVTWDKRKSLWLAQLAFNKKHLFLGYYRDKLDAATAYAEAASKYHGEFARI